MKITDAVCIRNKLIEQLRTLVPADKLNEVIESVMHATDISFEAGRTLQLEREQYFKAKGPECDCGQATFGDGLHSKGCTRRAWIENAE